MATARPTRPTAWCSHCGAYLAVPAGARSIRCALCGAVTRVERRPPHGLHQAVGFIKDLISSLVSPQQHPPPSSSGSLRPGGAYRMPASYPRVRGSKKRALLVGIGYACTKYELKGTVNDTTCMNYLLRERFGFPSESILVLTQEERDPYRVPTKENLRLAMRWLVEGCSSGDSLVFHFSGHGVQKLDHSGDEVDGYDEALCPQDFEDRGVILNDEINETIVRPLGPGVKLDTIVGTILDLPYLCRISRTGYWQWENHIRQPETTKGTSGGLAISISGCGDSQHTSANSTVSTNSTVDQRLRRQPNLCRDHRIFRLHFDRRHDVQLHQGGGIRAGNHLRLPAQRDAGDYPRQRRGVRHPRAHRLLLPPGDHLQLRTGAPTVLIGTV